VIATALEAKALKRAYPKLNRMTQTLRTTCLVKDGNVLELNQRSEESAMPKGKGTYGTTVGRPPKKKKVVKK